MKKTIHQFGLMLSTAVFLFSHHLNAQNLTEREDIKEFITSMSQKHHIESSKINAWLQKATIDNKIIEAIQKPYEALPWHRYQNLFVTQSRIDGGAEFYKTHYKTLQRAQKDFGVPAEIIVAILGVESRYGNIKGGHPVLDALVTLSFEYPPRSKFFKQELEEFLLLANEEGWAPESIKGSYAGAMGQAQFISSSYRNYAIDYNGDGKRDLINNTEDAIGSIANYFKIHGWQRNQPIVFPAQVKGDAFKKVAMSSTRPKPTHHLSELKSLGVSLRSGLQGGLSIASRYPERLALIELEEKNGPSFWLGTQNFYTITRYNHSNLYAMAVYELSEKIKAKTS